MYVGRFVVVGPEIAAYRVSSRSFPNRKVVSNDGALAVVPTTETEPDNPYVSYNCLRTTEDESAAVVANGTHTDPIVEKLDLGYPARDALAESLLAMDYEKDDYDTPRIAGVVGEGDAYIGIVRKDALLVEKVDEETLVATYEKDAPEPYGLDADSAEGAAREVYDADFEHAVCAAAAVPTDGGFERAIYNGEQSE